MTYIKNYICFVFFLFFGCANIMSPTGGEKDRTPPRLVWAVPEKNSLNFSEESIVLEFDEYIQVRNMESIKISPVCSPPPKIIVRGKRVEVLFFQKLEEETTYTINFSRSISDINEGNVLENFTYVFSTGDVLDSGIIKGSVKDLYFNKLIPNSLVGLYSPIDSINLNYYTFTELNGSFLIKNIKEGEYFIRAILDENDNLQYDDGEMTSLRKKTKTSELDNEIRVFYKKNPLKIDAKNINKGVIRFEHEAEKINIQILNSDGLWNKESFSSDFWFREAPLFIKYERFGVIDSVQVYNTIPSNLSLHSPSSVEEILLTKKIILKSNSPIDSFFATGFNLNENNPDLTLTDPFTIEISADPTSNALFTLSIDAGSIVNEQGVQNDSIFFSFNLNSNDYGRLNVLCSKKPKEKVVAELFQDKKVIRKCYLSDSTSMPFLSSGDYSLRIFSDIDGNYAWTPGDIENSIEPEPIKVYPEFIVIKPNWEVDIRVDSP